MRRDALAQRLLAAVLGQQRAEALVGDLLEEEPSRGRGWFWWSVATTGLAVVWLTVVGMLSGRRLTLSANENWGQVMNVWRFVWSRKWLVVIPVTLFTTVASVAAYAMPVRYRAQSRIVVVPSLVPETFVRSTVGPQLVDRVHSIAQSILSRTKLERIVDEFDLYREERKAEVMETVIQQMRSRDISVEVHPPDDRERDLITLTVSFTSTTPALARNVSDRIAGLFIQQNIVERELLADSTNQFLEVEVNSLAQRVNESAARIAEAESARRTLPRSSIIEFEELEKVYRALLAKQEEARMAVSMERRQIGEQFRILDSAQLPTHPDGPDRVSVSLFGATSGLGLGLVLMLASARRQSTPSGGDSQRST